MTFQEIITSLKKKEYAPVYVLHGDEPYYVDELVNYFESHILTETEKAFNQSILYGKEVDFKNVLDHARQFPVMAKKRLVILKEAQTMKTLPQLVRYVDAPNPSAILVIVHKHKKLDKRTAFYKSVSKGAIMFESKQIRERDLPAWISRYVKEHCIQIDIVAVEMLIELVGANLDKLSNELDKMMIGLQKGANISKDQVLEEIGLSKDFNIFELQSAIATGDIYKVHRITKYFSENIKNHPVVMIISVLYSFYSKLYIATAHQNVSDQQLAELLGYRSAWFVRDYKAASKRYTHLEIERCISILHTFDLKSKGIGARGSASGEMLKELIDRLVFVRQGVSA
jgi:DNA polymerase-3 subunit delta